MLPKGGEADKRLRRIAVIRRAHATPRATTIGNIP